MRFRPSGPKPKIPTRLLQGRYGRNTGTYACATSCKTSSEAFGARCRKPHPKGRDSSLKPHHDPGLGAFLTSLRNIIIEILQSRDFEVSDRDGFLFAKKGDSETMFYLFSSDERANIEPFLTRAKNYPGKKVIATLDILPPAIMETFDPNTMVWDREALEHEIGRSRVEK